MQARGFFAVALLSLALAGCALPSALPHPGIYRADLGAQWFTAAGEPRWPPDNGCAAPATTEILPPGEVIDRYGDEHGRFFSPAGASYESRALPYERAQLLYTRYLLRRALIVEACRAAPWFDEPGGAIQYKTDENAAELRQDGILVTAPAP